MAPEPEPVNLQKGEEMDIEVDTKEDPPTNVLKRNAEFTSVAKSSLVYLERTANEFLRAAYSGEVTPPPISEAPENSKPAPKRSHKP